MRHEQQRDTIDDPDRFPALLSRLVDPVFNENDIRIVEDLSGGFEADLVLDYIGFSLRGIPLKSAAKTVHLAKLYQ